MFFWAWFKDRWCTNFFRRTDIKLSNVLVGLICFVVFGVISVQPATAYVGLCCGKCGGNMPLVFPGSGVPETHEWRVKAGHQYMAMDGLRRNGNDISISEGLGSYNMVPEEMDMNMTNIGVGYSPSTRWFFMVMGMYSDRSMTMSNGNVMKSRGMTDMKLIGKRLLWADDVLFPAEQWSLITGVSLPTGSIDERDGNERLLPYGMQLGSGTFDPMIGLQYSGKVDPYWYGGTLLHTERFYDNSKGYRLGDKFEYDLFFMRQFRKDMVAELLVEGTYSSRMEGEAIEVRRDGVGHMGMNPSNPYMSSSWDPDNSGGNNVWVSGGIQWQPDSLLTNRPEIIDLTVGTNAYSDKNGIQMDSDWKATFTYYVEIPTSDSRRSGKFSGDDQGEESADELGF